MSVNANRDLPNLMNALDAIRNSKAWLALLFGGIVVALLTVSTGYLGEQLARSGMDTAAKLVNYGGALLATVLYFMTISAAGTSLLDQAKSLPQRSLNALFFAGLVVLPRLLGVVLLLLLIYGLIWLGGAALLFLAKIPGVGPLIYFVLFPVLSLLFGLFGFVVAFVVTPLTAPSIWDGHGVLSTIARVAKVAQTDLLKVILSQSLLFLLLLFVGVVVFAVVFSGIGATTSLSALVLNVGGGMGGMGGMYGMGGMDPSSLMYKLQMLSIDRSSYFTAGSLGASLLIGAAICAMLLIAISGNCLIYLRFAAGVDASAMEATMRERAQQMKARAEALQAQAKQQTAAAQQAWQERQQAAPPAAPAAPHHDEPAMSESTCPKCQSPVATDAVFCDHCGHRQTPPTA